MRTSFEFGRPGILHQCKIVKTIQVELAADTITAIYPFDGTPLNISWKKYMKDLPLGAYVRTDKMLEEILSIVEVFHENDFEHLDMAYRNILWSKKRGYESLIFKGPILNLIQNIFMDMTRQI